MAEQKKRFEYSPLWAQHVKGWYEEREIDEDKVPQPAYVGARCETCGEEFKRLCDSGLMRQHIAKFAVVHIHKPGAPT